MAKKLDFIHKNIFSLTTIAVGHDNDHSDDAISYLH